VTGARRDIQHAIGRLHMRQLNQAIQHSFVLVHGARGVEGSPLGEHGLRQNSHGRPQVMVKRGAQCVIKSRFALSSIINLPDRSIPIGRYRLSEIPI
jgi:hypothetical protein